MSAPIAPTTLTYLRDRGISRIEWIDHHGTAGQWTGDRCGCPDDRCIGRHHDADAPCGCVEALADDILGRTDTWRYLGPPGADPMNATPLPHGRRRGTPRWARDLVRSLALTSPSHRKATS